MSCLIDSNILIYFLNQRLPPAGREAVESAILSGATHASITRIEVLGWRGHTTESKAHARNLLAELREVPLSDSVIESAVTLRENAGMKLPDAIIAASALASGLPLMTRNTKDFRRARNLRLINPFLE